MDGYLKKILKRLIPVILIASNSVSANTAELDRALNIYYAGFPERAISLIEPLALSGDVDAQLLLGNILYSLSKSNKFNEAGDPVKWYKMAAVQNSTAANYALGVIYHNKWAKSHRRQDVEIAIFYYQKAVDLGHEDAQARLSKLKTRDETSDKKKPLSTSNSNVSAGSSKQTSKMPDENSSKQTGSVKVAGIAKQTPGENNSEQAGGMNLADTTKQASVESSGSQSSAIKLANIAQPVPGENIAIEPGRVYLADVAYQCRNYTRTGFNYYAESIQGAFIEGNAKIDTIGPTASTSATRLLKLTNKEFNAVISLTLQGVPKEVAKGLKAGGDFRVTGIVGHSEMIGSDCDLNLTYQSAK
jgi:hypothetical protein